MAGQVTLVTVALHVAKRLMSYVSAAVDAYHPVLQVEVRWVSVVAEHARMWLLGLLFLRSCVYVVCFSAFFVRLLAYTCARVSSADHSRVADPASVQHDAHAVRVRFCISPGVRVGPAGGRG